MCSTYVASIGSFKGRGLAVGKQLLEKYRYNVLNLGYNASAIKNKLMFFN
jgi:hypothetical protein